MEESRNVSKQARRNLKERRGINRRSMLAFVRAGASKKDTLDRLAGEEQGCEEQAKCRVSLPDFVVCSRKQPVSLCSSLRTRACATYLPRYLANGLLGRFSVPGRAVTGWTRMTRGEQAPIQGSCLSSWTGTRNP